MIEKRQLYLNFVVVDVGVEVEGAVVGVHRLLLDVGVTLCVGVASGRLGPFAASGFALSDKDLGVKSKTFFNPNTTST